MKPNLLSKGQAWFVVCGLVLCISCSTGKDSKQQSSEAVSSGSGSGAGRQDEGPAISGERKMLVNSMSNNSFTSKSVNKTKAAELAAQYTNSKSNDPQTAYGAIVSNRLAGKPATDSFAESRKILDHYISKNPDADVPESVQLELALAALQTGKLALAEFYLDKLSKSKSTKIKASAINALGVVAIRMDRIPEAVATFREALAVDKDFEPALMNIGFLALLGGDAVTAKRALGGMQDDWFVESGLVSVERLEGDSSKAEKRCEKILAKHPKHKPTLINCGINAYQGQRDFKKAREYLNRALAVVGGSAAWDERTGRLLGTVDAEEARVASAKAAQEAEQAKAKADAERAKAEAAAPKAPAAGASPQGAPQPATQAPVQTPAQPKN